MKASNTLLEALKGFEGLRLKSYKCPAGVWTIGYGCTKGVKAGMSITKEEAETMLMKELSVFEAYVNKLGVCKTQGQFDALVSFAYNLGCGALGNSTLLKYIKAGKPTIDIQGQFKRWCHCGGRVLTGLVKRRNWEAKRWAE